MNFTRGQLVWFMDECWEYRGMNEDGEYCLERPLKGCPFDIIEFEMVDASDDAVIDSFFADNGETFNEQCERKGIEIPNHKEKVKKVVKNEIYY